MNLFDIMRAAGGGNAFAALAPQYGLTEDQVAKAVEAFLPAFSAGLKRIDCRSARPDGVHAKALRRRLFRAPIRTRPGRGASGLSRGNDALNFLFGSQEVAQGVAKQASALTGIATEKLAELLPALAAMTFGGLAKQAAATNPVLDGMLKSFRARAGEEGRKGPARSLRGGAGAAREGSRRRRHAPRPR